MPASSFDHCQSGKKTTHFAVYICGKKKCGKDVIGIVILDLIGLLPTNHIIANLYYNGKLEFVSKRSMLTVLCYYMRNFCNLIGLEQCYFSLI